MMYPAMTNVRLGEVGAAFRSPRQLAVVLLFNYLVAPFVMLGLANIFVSDPELHTGLVLYGLAPCIAMVIIFTFLAKGNTPMALVFVALNSVAQGVGRLEGVVEEPAVVMDAGEPGDRNEFRAENLAPQIVDRLNFREEAVAPDVEAEAFVLRGPGNPADYVVGFEDRNPGKPLLREHVGLRQSCGPRTNHDHSIAGGELSDRARAARGPHHLLATNRLRSLVSLSATA